MNEILRQTYNPYKIYGILFRLVCDDKDPDNFIHKRYLIQYHPNSYDRDVNEFIKYLDIWCVLYSLLYSKRLGIAKEVSQDIIINTRPPYKPMYYIHNHIIYLIKYYFL